MYMPSFEVDILQVCAVEHVFQGFGDRPLTRRTEGLAPRRDWATANAGDIRTEGQKNIRYDVRACRLAREHKNISFHKKHIRPLRGGRPRTIVRVASRDIRADAEGEAVTGWRCLSCVVCTIFEIR